MTETGEAPTSNIKSKAEFAQALGFRPADDDKPQSTSRYFVKGIDTKAGSGFELLETNRGSLVDKQSVGERIWPAVSIKPRFDNVWRLYLSSNHARPFVYTEEEKQTLRLEGDLIPKSVLESSGYSELVKMIKRLEEAGAFQTRLRLLMADYRFGKEVSQAMLATFNQTHDNPRELNLDHYDNGLSYVIGTARNGRRDIFYFQNWPGNIRMEHGSIPAELTPDQIRDKVGFKSPKEPIETITLRKSRETQARGLDEAVAEFTEKVKRYNLY